MTKKELRRYAEKVYTHLMRCWWMWKEMAEGKRKWETEAYKKYRVACWACEFNNNNKVACPKTCIMVELWNGHCDMPGSPYYEWDGDSDNERKIYAEQIAVFALKKAKRIQKLHNIRSNWK